MATGDTIQVIKIILNGDPSVSSDAKNEIVKILEGKSTPGVSNSDPIDRMLSREDVARLMGVRPRTVTYYAKRGIIHPVRIGLQGKRAVGYSEQSVRAAMAIPG